MSDDDIEEQCYEDVKTTLRGFLKRVKGPLPHNAEITRDLEKAFRGILTPHTPDSKSWYDVRQNHAPGSKLYGMDEFRNDEAIFGDRVNREHGDEVNVDCCIIYDYLKFGTKLGSDYILFSNIYKTYAAGAWPCGWVGKYPDGHILVYWPFKEEPTFESL